MSSPIPIHPIWVETVGRLPTKPHFAMITSRMVSDGQSTFQTIDYAAYETEEQVRDAILKRMQTGYDREFRVVYVKPVEIVVTLKLAATEKQDQP